MIVEDSSSRDALRREALDLAVVDLASEEAQALALENDAVADTLQRIGTLSSDLAYLSLPRPLRASLALDLVLSLAAQSTLRLFAWRLPGFARANAAYLFENFLDCRAEIEIEADRCIVCLSRPPLHLVLGLTGMMSRRYELGWTSPGSFALYPQE